MDEYNLVCETFRHIKFYDFSTNYFVNRPRIAISINGSIHQKPDREYYVVFQSSTDYMIQVYKIDPETKRREGMLFGVLMTLKDGEYHHEPILQYE